MDGVGNGEQAGLVEDPAGADGQRGMQAEQRRGSLRIRRIVVGVRDRGFAEIARQLGIEEQRRIEIGEAVALERAGVLRAAAPSLALEPAPSTPSGSQASGAGSASGASGKRGAAGRRASADRSSTLTIEIGIALQRSRSWCGCPGVRPTPARRSCIGSFGGAQLEVEQPGAA